MIEAIIDVGREALPLGVIALALWGWLKHKERHDA